MQSILTRAMVLKTFFPFNIRQERKGSPRQLMNELPIQESPGLFLVPTDLSQLEPDDAVYSTAGHQEKAQIMKITNRKTSKLSVLISFLKRQPVWGTATIVALIFLSIIMTFRADLNLINPLADKGKEDILSPLAGVKPGYEVFGFAPHWTFNKLENIDFETLTTLAYFGVEAKADGNLDKDGVGYQTFMSPKATALFKKAHKNGTRVVLTITQMDNDNIKAILDDPFTQESIINQTVETVKSRGIDGVNIDFEYTGDPGAGYRTKFSAFAKNLTDRIHAEIPGSRVTASVYASAVKDPKIYNIKTLSEATDGIFMMAYDFAVAGSKNAIPTAPLYGHKEGKYWYDVSTAVDAFLTQMPSDKLILGVPWYGYNYAVEAPAIKTATTKGYYTYYKKGRRTYSQFNPLRSHAQTYSIVKNVNANNSEISDYREGFDEYGKVSWKAYSVGGNWRMVFIDDVRSQAIKYDFAKEKNLAGVGMWALGFDDGNPEIWDLLKDKFGAKAVADSSVTGREISD